MVQASLKIPAPAPLRVRLSSNAKCGTTWDNGISLTRSGAEILELGNFDIVDDYLIMCAKNIKEQQRLKVFIGEANDLARAVNNLIEV